MRRRVALLCSSCSDKGRRGGGEGAEHPGLLFSETTDARVCGGPIRQGSRDRFCSPERSTVSTRALHRAIQNPTSSARSTQTPSARAPMVRPRYGLLCAAFVLSAVWSSAQVLPTGCDTNASIPQMYLRSFYLVNKGKEWPVQGNLSILPDAVLVDGSNMLTGHPSTGVISRECVKAFIADPGNRYLVAFSLFLTENASVCLRFRFKPVVPNSFDLTFSFQVQDNGLPVCDTTHHLPSVHLGNTGATSPATRYQCASAGVIPADLVQKPAFTHCGLRAVDRIVPCYVGFNSGGWFVVRRSLDCGLAQAALSNCTPSPLRPSSLGRTSCTTSPTISIALCPRPRCRRPRQAFPASRRCGR